MPSVVPVVLALLVAAMTVLLLALNLDASSSDVTVRRDLLSTTSGAVTSSDGGGADAVTRDIAPAGPSQDEQRPDPAAEDDTSSAAGSPATLGAGSRAMSYDAASGPEQDG